MAEINIQRKKKPIWPWLLALVIIAGIIWVLAEAFDDPEDGKYVTESEYEEDVMYEDSAAMSSAPPDSIAVGDNEFVRFVKEQNLSSGDSLQPEYIIEGMDHLSAALGQVVDQKFLNDEEVNEKRRMLTGKIDQLKADTTQMDQPENIKATFSSAADLMKAIQEKSFPELNNTVANLKEVATSIDTGSAINTQKTKVQEFFEESSNVILVMTDTAGNNF